MKGASEYILKASDKIHFLKENRIENLNESGKKEVEDAINNMAM